MHLAKFRADVAVGLMIWPGKTHLRIMPVHEPQWERGQSSIQKGPSALMDHQNGPAPATTSIEVARVRELKTQGMEPAKIARTLKIGRASVYRLLGPTGTSNN